jgi:hypothetical protein
MVELSKLTMSDEELAAFTAGLGDRVHTTSLSEEVEKAFNAQHETRAAHKRVEDEIMDAHAAMQENASISKAYEELVRQNGIQEALDRVNRPLAEFQETMRRLTEPLAPYTELSRRIQGLTEPIKPLTDFARNLREMMEPLTANQALLDLARTSGLSTPSKMLTDDIDYGVPANDAAKHYLVEAPVARLPILDFEIPPNPAHETNKLLQEMISRTDELLMVHGQQAALIQELTKLSATSLEEARTSAAEAAKATKSAARSERLARLAIYLGIVTFVTSMAISSVQTWMDWRGGNETDATLKAILEAVRHEGVPGNVPSTNASVAGSQSPTSP